MRGDYGWLTCKGGVPGCVFAKGIDVSILDSEYEVIVNENEVEADKVSIIDEQKAVVERLVKALGYIDLAKSSFMVGGYGSEYNAKEDLEKVAKQIREDIEIHESHIRRLTKKERKLTRDKIIEKAKREVEEIRNDPIQMEGLLATFVVDREKRTVTALLASVSTGVVERQGVAKCHPDDCFNIHLGKIIALRRALGLEVPAEYLNLF